jgi:hypothetical protein
MSSLQRRSKNRTAQSKKMERIGGKMEDFESKIILLGRISLYSSETECDQEFTDSSTCVDLYQITPHEIRADVQIIRGHGIENSSFNIEQPKTQAFCFNWLLEQVAAGLQKKKRAVSASSKPHTKFQAS